MDFAQLFVCCTYVCSILFMEKGKYLQMLPRPTATPRVDTKKSIGFVHSSLQSIFYQTGPMWPTWERAGCQAPTASPPPPPLPPPYPSPPVQIWKSSTIKLLTNCPDKKYFLTWTPSSEPGSESLPISLPGGENMKTFQRFSEFLKRCLRHLSTGW